MFNKQKFNELNNRIGYTDKQKTIAFSNLNFKVLVKLVNNKKLKPTHVAFAFSYLYLQTYLFRYTKYDRYVPKVNELKNILTYDKTTKTLNYIIKDGGLLDAANLTKTIYDFPVVHTITDSKELEFDLISEFNDGSNRYGTKWRLENKVGYNASCKYPVLAFHSDLDKYKQLGVQYSDLGGSFFGYGNFTLIDWDMFAYCMSNDEIGVTGFYLHSFIKWHEGLNGNCQMGIDSLADQTGLSESIVSRALKILRQHNLVHCISADFVIRASESKHRIKQESNTYFANSYDDITSDKKELTKPNYITVETYLKNNPIYDTQNLDNTEFYDLF